LQRHELAWARHTGDRRAPRVAAGAAREPSGGGLS
jgi:hypothetical protein